MNDQLADLLLPPSEPLINYALYLGLGLLLAVLVLSFWFWKNYQNKPLTIAKKRLKELNSEYLKQTSNPHEVALKLSNILCTGLEIKRLDQYQPVKKTDWDTYHKRLNAACYSSVTDNKTENINMLLAEAKHWLNHKNDD